MDKYDEAIAYLTEHPDEIEEAWMDGSIYPPDEDDKKKINPGACLLRMLKSTGMCLTMMKNSKNRSGDPYLLALVVEVNADDRIPDEDVKITVESLPAFAEWQRRFDREFNRKD
jgi:hypothetical protein